MSKEKLKEILKDPELVSLLKELFKESDKPTPKKRVVRKKKAATTKKKQVTNKEFYDNFIDDLPVNEEIVELDKKDAQRILKIIEKRPRVSQFQTKKCDKCGNDFNGFISEFICNNCIKHGTKR